MNPRRRLPAIFWAFTMIVFIAALVRVYYTPERPGETTVQYIYYLHVPIAINAFLACAVCFVASIGYLWQRRLWWDDLACAAANIAVVLCSGVLLSGMIWGHSRWSGGQDLWKGWWTWSPRLTFSFVLWLLYVVYLVVRGAVSSSQRRAVVGAVYGLVAFLDVPLVYLSSMMLPAGSEDIHPEKSPYRDPAMHITFMICLLAVMLLTVNLLVARYRLQRRQRLQAEQQFDAPDASPQTNSLLGGNP